MRLPWWLWVVECELEEGMSIPQALFTVATLRGKHLGKVAVVRILTLPIPIKLKVRSKCRQAWSVGWHWPSISHFRDYNFRSEFNFYWLPWKVDWLYDEDVV